VILGCDEQQPLMKENIPLPVGRPAAVLKYVSDVTASGLQAVSDCFQAWASHSGQIENVALPLNLAVRAGYCEGLLRSRKSHSWRQG
jgi:hypothetical protein